MGHLTCTEKSNLKNLSDKHEKNFKQIQFGTFSLLVIKYKLA